MISVLERVSTKRDELDTLLDKGYKLPEHVAIIMDGNGRWAKRRALPRTAGHREGVKSVRNIVEAAGNLNLSFLTLYTFSKENWRRPVAEVSMLMRLLVSSLKKEIRELVDKNVRLRALGDLNDLPGFARDELLEAEEMTRKNTGLNLNLALSYGGRSEIVSAVKKVVHKVMDGQLYVEDIDDAIFADCLYTKDIPDPDLLIRTSGEQRISNFLLWQLAYSELYLTHTCWPDFREEQFYEALITFMHRERRYGMVSEQVQK